MATCQVCGDDYRPLPLPDGRPAAWPEGVCGQCIAARVELELLRPLLGDGMRKPLQRAVHELDLEVFVQKLSKHG